MRRALILLLLFCLCLSLFSCGENYGYLELRLEMPRAYETAEAEGSFDRAYSDGRAVIGITRLSFEAAIDDGIIETYTPEAFAKYYKKRIDKSHLEVYERGEVPYIIYTEQKDGVSYFYQCSFYRTKYAYFVVVAVCREDLSEMYSEEFLDIASSAYIKYK